MLIQVSRSIRPAKAQKGGGSIKKLQLHRGARWLERLEGLQDRPIVPPHQQVFHELRSKSDKHVTILPRATKSHRGLWEKNEIMSLDIPYENFVGSILGGRFQLQYLRCQEDHLDIYSVTSLSGLSFEAQAFSLSGLSEKLLRARKRRIKRLLQSENFVCEIEQAGKRFLIIEVERSDAEWKNLSHKIHQRVTDWMSHDSCLEDFPDLSTNKCRRESFSSDSKTKVEGDLSSYLWQDTNKSQDMNSLFSSRPSRILNSRSSRSSYAEVASKGLEFNKSSKTCKGIRQRQRRQRKREGGDARLIG